MTSDEQAVEERARQALAWRDKVMDEPGTTFSAMRVAFRLAGEWVDTGKLPSPLQADLARELGISERMVVKAIGWLRGHGFVEVQKRGRENRYVINWSRAAAKRVAE